MLIAYTGGRMGDANAANFASHRAATPAFYTWHHVEDYDPGTNRGHMQLVQSAPHNNCHHRGGVWMWQNHHGQLYRP